METLEQKKTKIRKQMKMILKGMDPEKKKELDAKVCEQFLAMPEIREVKQIYGYMALAWETGTEGILKELWNRGIDVALPKVLGSEMDFFQVGSMEDLEEGAFHILEPKSSCEKVYWSDAVLMVPGLAFTLDGKRLGKGGGFYDKYLERYSGHKTVALAYDYQIVDDLPAADHDRSVEFLVTESRTTACSQ